MRPSRGAGRIPGPDTAPKHRHVDAGDTGYRKDLAARHINMIAIGGAIGTGLFLGARGRPADAGPSLFLAYAVCGVVAFLVVRILGELVPHRPSSGAFVSHAREFTGEKSACTAGWPYFLNWATTAMADITAAATHAHFRSLFTDVPQWLLALVALAVVPGADLIPVRYSGETEYWFAIVKVAALVVFRAVGIVLVVAGQDVGGHVPGPATVTENGGLFPHGLVPTLMVVQGVVFATVFGRLGAPGAADVMNLVVLTAALSSLNSGLYSTGRILRSMSLSGSAPKCTGLMNRGGVPYGGILLTAGLGALGVVLNHVMPGEAFEPVLNFASVGVLGT